MTKKKNNGTLTMVCSGSFPLKVSGPNHCGVGDQINVGYKVKIKCKESSLDDRGFMFDQLNVHKFFTSMKKTVLSCEKLCIRCGSKLLKEIKKENPRIEFLKCEVTLAPSSFASMTHVMEF